MRVGIHSGRVLCGILGKKKWQFDVHSNDVKLANLTEQSGIPGRVHITEDTLKSLDGRYEVEEANGHMRDTYIAQRNVSTYFVIPPQNRRPFAGGFVSGRPSLQYSDQTVALTSPAGASIEPTGQRAEIERVPSGILGHDGRSRDSMIRQSVCSQQQGAQQAPQRLTFKLATQRIINALHFIRTIDAPFANLESPSISANLDRMMLDTIESRCHIQDIHPVTLEFKDQHISRLYGNPRWVQLLKRLFLFLASIVCLFYLAIQQQDWDRRAAQQQELQLNQRDEPSLANTINQNPAYSDDNDRIESDKSLALLGSILPLFLITILVYIHQVEHNERRDFLWRQIALQDKDRMALMRDCNRFIFFNLLPAHVANYFLEQRVASSHMVSSRRSRAIISPRPARL